MSSPAAPSRLAASSGGALAAILVLAVAFVVAPPMLAGSWSGGGFVDERHLGEAFRAAFAGYWRSGGPDLTPDLQRVVDYWFGFHVVKAVVAVVLLIVLGAVGFGLGKVSLRAGGRGKRVASASAGLLAAMLGFLALAAALANIQGAVAPFASLFPLLLDGPPADTVDQISQHLAGSPGAPPALDVMISDFAWYHQALAEAATVAVVVLIGTGVVAWKKSGKATFGVLPALSALALIVVAVANVTTAADPVPAFSALFEGGW